MFIMSSKRNQLERKTHFLSTEPPATECPSNSGSWLLAWRDSCIGSQSAIGTCVHTPHVHMLPVHGMSSASCFKLFRVPGGNGGGWTRSRKEMSTPYFCLAAKLRKRQWFVFERTLNVVRLGTYCLKKRDAFLFDCLFCLKGSWDAGRAWFQVTERISKGQNWGFLRWKCWQFE